MEATAFRETTIKNEREPESAVLWKALLALKDGKDVLLKYEWQRAKDCLLPTEYPISIDSFDRVLETYAENIGNTTFVYPIVAVGAEMHLLERGELRQIDHVRLRVEAHGQAEFCVQTGVRLLLE